MISVENLNWWAEQIAIGRNPEHPKGFIPCLELMKLANLTDRRAPINVSIKDIEEAFHVMRARCDE